MTKAELVKRLLKQDRGASEAEDAIVAPAPTPMPLLTDEQCAAVDETAGLT